MKVASKHRTDRLTAKERKDVERSLKEIKEGKAGTVKSVDQLIEELKTN